MDIQDRQAAADREFERRLGHCGIRVCGDSSECQRCGNAWDTNDIGLPACPFPGARLPIPDTHRRENSRAGKPAAIPERAADGWGGV